MPCVVLLTEPYWHAKLSKPILLGILGHLKLLNSLICEFQVFVSLFTLLVNKNVDFQNKNMYIDFGTSNILHFSFKTCWFWSLSQSLGHFGKIANFRFWFSEVALFHWSIYCWNLTKLPSQKMFLIVLSVFSFLDHPNRSFVAQVMAKIKLLFTCTVHAAILILADFLSNFAQ